MLLLTALEKKLLKLDKWYHEQLIFEIIVLENCWYNRNNFDTGIIRHHIIDNEFTNFAFYNYGFSPPFSSNSEISTKNK